MSRRVERSGNSVILYDDSVLGHVPDGLFEPGNWPDAPVAPGYSGGRGSTLFIQHENHDWVLRHYHRGGFMSRWLTDQFLWTGQDRTRAFREWMLLQRLTELGLPSPRPVACRVVRRGLIYSADLITERIRDVVPLSVRLVEDGLGPDGWNSVGRMVALFHRHNVFHADLTAHNIQIDTAGKLFLLDFDRGKIMPGPGAWMRRNLARLQRSLNKISRQDQTGFDAVAWQQLLDGYGSVVSA